jgi:hypothetical protein
MLQLLISSVTHVRPHAKCFVKWQHLHKTQNPLNGLAPSSVFSPQKD